MLYHLCYVLLKTIDVFVFQRQMLKSTMMEINKHREQCRLSPMSTVFAMKFLNATDFDADDAVTLYHNYMVSIY